MTNPYARNYNRRQTPQSERVPGREDQVENNAGGFVFAVDKWQLLERFLILGSEGGTYYVNERKLTKDNAKNVEACVAEDGQRAIQMAVEISQRGRAPKNDPAIFVIALGTGASELETRQAAFDALPKVCRIPTHLFHFAEMVKGIRGWGGGLRRAVASWYNGRPADKLAYQMAKYKSRDGWSHRDLLLLSHAGAAAPGPEHRALYRWATVGLEDLERERTVKRRETGAAMVYPGEELGSLPEFISAIRELELMAVDWKAAHVEKVIDYVERYGLTHEMIPTQAKRSPKVWDALLQKMPLTAMIRNLANMTKVGLLEQLSEATGFVVQKLQDEEHLRKSRVHPMQVLVALKTYSRGTSPRARPSLFGYNEPPAPEWNAVPQIVDALDEAFYRTFGNVEPTNKRTLYALDISGSMGHFLGNIPLTHAEVAAAMAMVCMRTEPNYAIVGFGDGLRNLDLSPRMRLDDVLTKTRGLTFGRTDCSLPAQFAKQKGIKDLEAVVIVTDNETWHGMIHPYQALEAYRNWAGVPTRQIVMATAATPFTIADPKDPLSLDVVGFDTAVPNVIAEFIRGADS